jgi:hypothetical protein
LKQSLLLLLLPFVVVEYLVGTVTSLRQRAYTRMKKMFFPCGTRVPETLTYVDICSTWWVGMRQRCGMHPIPSSNHLVLVRFR